MTNRSLLLLMSILALAAPAAAQAPDLSVPNVVTSGEGIVRRAPDRAWVNIGTESRARTPQEAERTNADAMSAVNQKLKAAGVPGDAIQTIAYDLQPEFDYNNGRRTLRDYVARNQVMVKVDALSKLGDILAAAVGTGATNVSGIRFDLQDRDAVERDALRRAVADARGRAESAAAGAGMKIERVLKIEEHRDHTSPPPHPMMAEMNGPLVRDSVSQVPIEGGTLEIHANVTLTAAIR